MMENDQVFSAEGFKWFITVLVGGVAGLWALHDLRNLVKLRSADSRDPLVGDKRFGYIMGIIIGIGGVIGCLLFHDVL